MINYFKKIINRLLPYPCLFCKKMAASSLHACQACLHDLPILPYGCLRCANILPISAQKDLCGQCLKNPSAFDETHAIFIYQPPITRLILDLKFHHALVNGRLIGELLAEKIEQEWYREKTLPTAIIPVPLHQKRLKERGFNQAIEIARPIKKKLKLPLLKMHCARIKPTKAQANLPANERKQNVLNAFTIRYPIKHQHVAVIDDVMTTGATLNEFCRILKKHGVQKIDVWCTARALNIDTHSI
ncbi:MAG: Protein GntX [uncultured bacterium]|nr:MAG: Protein GntX [uncultured bacterium]